MSESCTLSIQPTERGYIFRVEGHGTMRESPVVRDFACGAIEGGAKVVADLSACEYLDSTFLGCLVLLHKRGESYEGSFAVHADATVRDRLFAPMGLQRLFTFSEECPPPMGPPVTLGPANLKRWELHEHLLETHRKLADLDGPTSETFRRIADLMAQELTRNPQRSARPQ